MAFRFVSVDHDTPMLLPPDLRDWVPVDHIVHFVMDAVMLLDLSSAKINHRGTGSAQYPPSMMLGLLIYSYATGTFSSRKIEKLTYENLAVRFLTGDTHPDHDSICTFRRENKELMESAFHRILHCAALSQILKVGDITIAIDGTKILANASKHGAVSHGHTVEQMKLLEDQIAELLAKAEDADSTPLQDGLSIPAEITRREDRIGKLKQATAVIEARAAARCREETDTYQQKLQDRERKQREAGRKPPGKPPAPPKPEPGPKDQYNFTDPESRIMRAGGAFQQCYNAQAAVEVQSRLIVGGYVTDAPNDKQQLIPALASISSVAGQVGTALVDSGYYSAAAVTQVETGGGPQVLAATGRKKHGRTIAVSNAKTRPPRPKGRRSPKSWHGAPPLQPERSYMDCAKKRSNPSLASLRKHSASAAFIFAASAKSILNGRWCGSLTTSSDSIISTNSRNQRWHEAPDRPDGHLAAPWQFS